MNNLLKAPPLLLFVLCSYLVNGQNTSPGQEDCYFTRVAAYQKECVGCESYFKIGQEAYQKRNAEKVIEAWGNLIVHAQRLEDFPLLACIYPKLNKAYKRLQNYVEAIRVSLLFLELPDSASSEEERIKAHSNLSELYSALGLWEQAYEHHLKSYEAALDFNDKKILQQVNYQSGSVFYFQEKYTEALAFYEEALNIAIELKDQKQIATIYGGLASTARAAGDLVSAKFFAFKQLEFSARPVAKANAMNVLAGVYRGQGQIDSALYYFSQSLQIYKEEKVDFTAFKITKYLGDIELERGDIKQAEKYYLTCLSDSTFTKFPIALEVFQHLAKIYEKENNHEQAAYYLQQYIDLQGQFTDDGTQIILDKQKVEFQLEQKAAQVVQLEQENEIRRLNNFLYTAGLLVMFIIIIGGFWAYWVLSKAHRVTKEQKEKIEEQNEKLILYNQRLKRFSSVVSHDLKQPLRTTISMMSLLTRKYFDQIPEKGRELIQMIKDSNKQMFQLIEGLLQLSTLEKPSEEAYEWVNSVDLPNNALQQLDRLVQEKGVCVKHNIPIEEWPDLFVHPAQITQVWQNLLANAIKFCDKEQPKVTLGYLEEEGHHVFFVEDNGIGIAPEHQGAIFEMFSRLNSHADYEGSGIGLATCKQILQNHDGKISVKSELGKGSTFFFSLQKKNNPNTKIIAKAERLLTV